jgi:hypothetical protein
VAVIGTASGLVHECAHVLAAAARGVPSRVSIGRRLIAIVHQTDLTRLWGVPRRARAARRILVMSIDAVTAYGPVSVRGAAGVVALVLTVASTAFVVIGTAQTVTNLATRLVRGQRPTRAPDQVRTAC